MSNTIPNKFQPLWDVQLKYIAELEAMEQEQIKNPTFGLKKIRNLIKLQKSILHSALGWRKKYHDKPVIKPSEPQVLPTEKHADKTIAKLNPSRLTVQHTSDIKALEMEGLSLSEISDRLMLDEDKIKKYLGKLRKDRQPRNLLHTSNSKKK